MNLWTMARVMRVLVLLVWWLGCQTDGIDGVGSGGGGPRHPPELGPTECDRLGGQWIPTTATRAGGFCRLGGGVVVLPELSDAGADARD